MLHKSARKLYLIVLMVGLLLMVSGDQLPAASFKISNSGDFSVADATFNDVVASDTTGADADFLRLRNTNPGEDGNSGLKFGGRGVWARKREIAFTIPNDFHTHTAPLDRGKAERVGEKVKIDLTQIGNANADWSDLRLTDWAGNQRPFRLLDFERPTDNLKTPVKLLFEVNAHPAWPAASNTYHLYYKNAEAAGVEDTSLSQFYITNHDFEDGLNGWSLCAAAPGVVSADGLGNIAAAPNATNPTLAIEPGISIIPGGYVGFNSNACLSMGYPEGVNYPAGAWRAYEQSVVGPSTGTYILTAQRRFTSASWTTGWYSMMFLRTNAAGRDRRYFVAAGFSDWSESSVDFTPATTRIVNLGLGMWTSVGGATTLRERRSQFDWAELKLKYPLESAMSGELSAGYAQTGFYESRKFDTGVANPVFESITWSANTTAPGTSVAFQTRTAAVLGDLDSAAWSAPITINGSGIAAPARYLQVRAILSTTDTSVSPVLNEIEIFYSLPVDDFRIDVPATVGAGEYFDFRVTAIDQNNATVTSFLGNLTLSASPPPVEFPRTSHLFTAFDNGTTVFQARKPIAEDFIITAVSGLISSDSLTIQTTPADTVSLELQGLPAAITAGALFSGQIVAKDRYGNTDINNNGQIVIQTTDAAPASFPASINLVAGIGNLTDCSFFTAPIQTLEVKEAASGIATFTDMLVSAGAATRLRLSAEPDQYQDVEFNLEIAAVDDYGNPDTSVDTAATLTSSLGTVATPSFDIVAGLCTHPVTLDTAGNLTLSALTATALPGDLGLSVHPESPPTLHRFLIDAGYDQLAGVPFTLTIEARDSSEQVLTSYDGACRIIPSVGQCSPAMTTGYKFLDGFLAIPISLSTADSNVILRVEDVKDSSKIGLLFLNVRPAGLAEFEMDTPPAADAGATFTFKIRARDNQDNLLTNYTGTVIISHTATGGDISIPTIYTFLDTDAGEKTFSGLNGASFTKAENIKIQVEDSGKVGLSEFVTIRADSSDPIVELRPDVLSVELGTSLSFNLYLKDRFDNALEGFIGTMTFSYSDVTVIGPASYAFKDFENGYKRFLLAVKPANLGDFTITATEDLSGNSDTTDVITVISGETINFTFDPSTKNLVAGENFSFDVTASNSAGNLNEQYNGGIRFSTLDPLSLIPQDSTLVNGQGTFQATYFTAGSYQLSVFDINSPSISGNMTVVVQASAPRRLEFELPSYSTEAGIAVSYRVKIVDAYGNPASFTGNVTLSSPASPPQNIAFSNQASFDGLWTLTTAGAQKLRAVAVGLTAAESLPIMVTPGPADSITGDFPTFASSELVNPFVVRVIDQYGNPTPQFTSKITASQVGGFGFNIPNPSYTFSAADNGATTFFLRWDYGNPGQPPSDVTVTFTPDPPGSVVNGATNHTLRVDNPRNPSVEFPFLRSWLSLPDRQVVASEPFQMSFRSFSIRETDVAITSRIAFSISDGGVMVSRDGINYDSFIDVADESSVSFWAIVTRTGFLSMLATPQIAPTQTGSISFMSYPGPVNSLTIASKSPQKAGVAFPWTVEWWDYYDNYARRATGSIDLAAVAVGNAFLDPALLTVSGRTGRFNQDENRSWLTNDFIVASATSNLKIDPFKQQISIQGLYDEDFSRDILLDPAGIWKTQRVGTDGTGFVVTSYTVVGNHTFTPPAGVVSVDYLVVAGGGGGGAWRGGGGGAGGMRTGTMAVVPGVPVAITVGGGGAGAPGGTDTSRGTNGQNSGFGAITSTGGGGGGIGRDSNTAAGNGGSGGGAGGASAAAPTGPAGTGIVGQGRNGGNGNYNNTLSRQTGGGGGGAGAVGANGQNVNNGAGGAGGAGLISNIVGTNVYYAGGGGGSSQSGGSGAGGLGGGGAGNRVGNGFDGRPNTGGGGGGAGGGFESINRGGSGGSGIVIVSYAAVLPATTYLVQNDQLQITTVGTGTLSMHTGPSNTGTTESWYEHSDDSYYYLYFDWPANDIFAFEATLAIKQMWYDSVLDYSPSHAGILMRDDSDANRPRFVSAMLRRVDSVHDANRDIGIFFVQAVYRIVPGNAPDTTRRFRRRTTTNAGIATTQPMWVRLARAVNVGATPGRFFPQACHDGQSWRLLDSSPQTVAATTNPHPNPGVNLTKLGISIGAANLARPAKAWFDEFTVNRYPQSASFTSVVYDIGTSAVTLTDPIRVEADFNTGTANARLYMRGSNDAATVGAQAWINLPLTSVGGTQYTAIPPVALNRRYIQYALLLSANWVGNNGGQDFYDATPYVRSVQIDYTTGVQGATFAERNVEPPATIIASFSPTITAETQVEILGGTVASLAIDVPASATAGVPFTISVKALDAFGNIADDYDKTWSFMTSDGDPFPGVVPGDYTMVPAADAGQHTFYNASVLFNGPTKTITVTDGTLTTVSDPIIVNPGRIGAFALFALSPQAAGTIFPLSIEALDVYNNLKTNYSGIMTFNDNRTGGTALYSPATLAAASWTTGLATLTPGVSFTNAETINVTGQSSYRSGVSNPIEISNAPPAALLLSVSTTSPDSGIPFSVTLKVLDIYGNIARNYLGTVHFSCNDAHPAVALPVNYLFTGADAGQKVFTDEFVLITPGSVNLRVVDTVNATMTHQFPLTVLPGPATRFELSCSDIQTAGVPFNLIVKVYDDYGNIKTNFSETINLLSSFTSILPFSAGGFSNGQLLIPSVELNEVGVMPATKKIAAVFGSVVGDKDVALWPSSLIFDRFDMETIPLEPTVGDAFKLVIKAVGPDGNVFTGYDNAGVFLTASNSSGLAVDPPMMPVEANGFTIGVKELYARNWEAGEITIWAANKGVPPVVGSLTVNFLPTNLSHFTVVPGTSTVDPFPNNYYQTVNGSFPVFLKAYDTIGNIKTDYTGTVQITHNGIGTLSVTLATFVDGVATISATAYNNPGKIRLTARDGVLNRSGTSGNIYFFGPLARFDVACGYDQTDETAFLTMLSAIDVYDQEKLNYNSQANTQRLAWNLGPLTDVALMPPSLPLTWDDGKNYVWLKVDRPAAGADIGTFTFNVLDDADSSKTGTATVNIHKSSVLPAVGLLIEVFSPQQSTKPFPMAVKAVDVNNAVVKSWSGDTTLGIVSTLGDTETLYPSAISLADFVDGVYATTTARIDVPATYTVTAVSGALTGVFSPLYVKPGKVSEIRLTVPPYAPLNSPFTISVAGLTADGQVKSDYVPEGPIHLKLNATSTGYLGVQFVYPEDFSGGMATINTQTYNKSQTIWITAIEIVDNLKSTAGPILVFGPPVRLVLKPQPDASANFYWNAWFQVRVNVLDVNGYPVANFSGDIDFSAQPGGAPTATDPTILPGFESQFFDVDSMGSQLFYLKVLYSTPASPINLVLEAENAANSIADVTGNLTFLKESVFDSFEIVSPTSGMAVPKNRPFPVRVRAVDNFGMPYTLLSSFPTLTAELLSPPGLTMFSASPTSPLEFLNTSELLLVGNVDYAESSTATVRFTVTPEDMSPAGDMVDFAIIEGYNIKDSVYQEIATTTFTNPGRYILSGYVSPGTGSADIKFTLIDAVGEPVESYGVRIASSGVCTHIGPLGPIVSYGSSRPIAGGNSLSDHNLWYRIHVVFDYQFVPAIASETIIHLQNSTPDGYPASASVLFDGMLLEKTTDLEQMRPTSFAPQGWQIYSPSRQRSLSGEYQYYEQ